MFLPFIGLALLLAYRPFPEDRNLLDRRLETLRRILPDGPSPVADAAYMRDLAVQAGLADVQAIARPPLESGARGTVAVDLVGSGRFAEVDRFFRQVAVSPRLVDTDTLTLTPVGGDQVRVTSLLQLPYRPLAAPLPPPPVGSQAHLQRASRQEAEAFVRDQALAWAKSETIAELRRRRRNPRLFLSEVAAVVRDRPVILTRASLGEDFLISGVTVGEAPMRAFERRLERGFFRIADVLVVRQGGCHRFEVKGRAPVVGPDAEIPLPSEDPFGLEGQSCRVDRDAGKNTILYMAKGRVPSGGPLSLRLRGVDLADIFHVLHRITSQGFLVDADVQGRVTLDVSNVDMAGLVSVLERTGIRVLPAGPVQRVSRGRSTESGEAPRDGPRISFSVKRAEVRDILMAMAEADPDLVALGPPGSLGRLSIWAKDVSVAGLRTAVLQAAGLSESVEEEERVVTPSPRSDAGQLAPIVGDPQELLTLQPNELSVEEFELSGLASAGAEWVALAYSPAGVLYVYRAGDRLANATIRTVQSTDVVLDTEEGPLQIVLPEAGR
jgi:hypothetical protein